MKIADWPFNEQELDWVARVLLQTNPVVGRDEDDVKLKIRYFAMVNLDKPGYASTYGWVVTAYVDEATKELCFKVSLDSYVVAKYLKLETR